MQIVVGTSNPGKIREIASIFMPLGYELVPYSLDVEEIGDTIEENAEVKAKGYSQKFPGQYVLVEDSGLVVPKLHGLPGPYSSRFHTVVFDDMLNVLEVPKEQFTTDKTQLDKENNKRLVEFVEKHLKEDERAAYFEVCFIVAKDGEILQRVTERANGFITTEPRGTNGFGYDPLFVGTDTFGKTYAELDNARKNLRSHRKKALQKLGLWVSKNIPLDE